MAEVVSLPGSLSALLQEEYACLMGTLGGVSVRERARILRNATDYLLRMQKLGFRIDAAFSDTLETEYARLLRSIQSATEQSEGTGGLTVGERLEIVSSATTFLLKRRKLKRHDVNSGVDLLQIRFRDARRTGRRRGAS
jgi:hypothetical protein